MDDALDEIAFLANSENRVTVFESLVEGPRSRDEIRARVDASRVTVARILRELEERSWIEHRGQEYTVTPLGEWVCDEFVQLAERMETEQRLRPPLQWFPDELLTFDVRSLHDAEVVRVDESDATSIIRQILEFHRAADRLRGVARMVAPVFVENHWELTVEGDTRFEMVVTPEVIDVIRDHPRSARQFGQMLDEPDVDVSVYEDVPLSVGIVDGAVGINLTDEQGVIKGALRTEDDTVLKWALDLFARCRRAARPVSAAVLAD